ncbi:uncharacterized protein LOC135074217 [Ostrinia nubilalis]|uniref:uncharacterized protein LOC114362724 n=1 Tax=Ostrinia furnacalis TaxID=93504 RepID=UPI00103D22EB|nr:uncharacterized protein LOC114362724 [Ostrinia furnacalis]
MRSKLLALSKAVTTPSRTIATTRRCLARQDRCDAHMNELPIPCGPWDIWYKDKQSFYNKVLVAGALWWLFSFGMVLWTDSVYLNWGPPAQPGPPSDMVEECEDIE